MINFMEIMRSWLLDEESKIMFILSLLTIAMLIDMITGTIGAKVNKDINFISGKGINGILRKMGTLIVAIFFIPTSVLIPNGLGTVALYTMLLGLLSFEVKSIFENLEKMGADMEFFKDIFEKISKKK